MKKHQSGTSHQSNQKPDFSRNISLFYLLVFFRQFFVIASINVLYYFYRGMDLTAVLLLTGILGLGMVIFDFPAEHFSFKYGRKTSLLLSMVLLILSYILLAFVPSSLQMTAVFYRFVVAMILMAASMSLQSNSDASLIYDSLVHEKKEHEYADIESKSRTISFVSLVISALIGSWLYIINPVYPYYALILTAFFGFFCIIPMREPPETLKEPVFPKSFKAAKHAASGSFSLLGKNAKLRSLFIFFIVVYASTQIAFRLFQPLMLQAKIPVSEFGIIYAFFIMAGAVVVQYQDLIERKARANHLPDLSLWIIPLIIGVGLLLALSSMPFLLILGLLLIQVFSYYLTPLISLHLRVELGSSERNLIFPMAAFFGNILILLLAPILGFMHQNDNVMFGLVILAAITIIGSYAALFLRQET